MDIIHSSGKYSARPSTTTLRPSTNTACDFFHIRLTIMTDSNSDGGAAVSSVVEVRRPIKILLKQY